MATRTSISDRRALYDRAAGTAFVRLRPAVARSEQ
jgi:hypothetical protein